jgi:two-component system NtrC family sensor kinase
MIGGGLYILHRRFRHRNKPAANPEMVRAQRDSIRLLQGALVAAIALPLALFTYACWFDYRNVYENADKQIARTTDVINEHALKVFEAVQRALAEVNEVVHAMPDSAITAQQAELHARLRRIAEGSAEIKSLWIFDRDGRALVNSLSYPVDSTVFSDRDYFNVHGERDRGTYVGRVLRPRPPYGGAPFFGVSRRRISDEAGFAGVVQASVLPEYFEGFYEKLAREPGEYASIVRADGTLLARYPSLGRDAKLAERGPLYQSMLAQPTAGKVTLISEIDGTSRTVSYRKLPDFPVFVLAGLETSAIRDQWLSQMRSQLIFGLPATAALICIIALALRRTRRLYEEAAGRLAAEDALKQAQRLEALGQLTGGVAHDFNNLLMVIGGSVERLKSPKSDAQAGRSISMIEAAVQKGASLTRQLLSFSRRQSLSPRIWDAVMCVREFREVLQQSARGDIQIAFDLPEAPLPVRVDRHELEIALLNLILNARDAMPDGGAIRICVAGINLLEGTAPHGLHGEFVSITIADTGEGIPEEIRDHVFEPYFTTKKMDKGTGLGLSQVYGFARQSGGVIDFQTQLGAGTTFTMLLPRSREPLHDVMPPTASVDSLDLRVLLVEDNLNVAVVAQDYLERCGCTVVRAESADTALDLLNADTEIQLVFSDILMPGMNGLELARLVREHHPEIGLILASGYSDKAAVAVSEGFLLLNKPYSLETLRTALAQEHAGSRAAA